MSNAPQTSAPELSVVLPVFNEQGGLPEVYRRVKAVLVKTGLSHEIIFVNDGSRDGSWQVLLDLANRDRMVKAVNLSRNFGHQVAITAGIDASGGASVIVMDSDLQDPPELIEALLQKYREGFDVVYAQRRTRDGETWFKRTTARVFYRVIRSLTTVDMPIDTGEAETTLVEWSVSAHSHGEVDELRWVEPAQAATLLTHESDRTLLSTLTRLIG